MLEQIFISYAQGHDDTAFAIKLYDELKKEENLLVCLDRNDADTPENRSRMEESIQNCWVLIFVATKKSINSARCSAAWNYALRLRKPVLPVTLEPFHLPRPLDRRQHIDFTGDFAHALTQLKHQLSWLRSDKGEQQTLRDRLVDLERESSTNPDAVRAELEALYILLALKEGTQAKISPQSQDANNITLIGSSYKSSNNSRQEDWEKVPRIENFYGREKELGELKQWVENEHCRLILLLGAKNIGKTTLAAKLVEQIKDEFEYVFWCSLQIAPPLERFLKSCIQFLSHHSHRDLPKDIEAQITLLIESLKNHHCLLIVDNIEAILQFNNRTGQYREGYEGYGRLLLRVGETQHQSCLLLTSRENIKEMARLEGQASSFNKSLLLIDRDEPIHNVWNVPYRRNLSFTGRKNLLVQLHDKLATNKSAALIQPQAICGLGGIGKTQVAIEYAYCYRGEYPIVLWIRAATRETIITDFVEIAALLHLPGHNVAKQSIIVVAAVKEWLACHMGWLIIFDNVDDIDLINDFLPTESKGHILITTRLQATGGVANTIAVEKMTSEEGVSFLLRRAKLLMPDAPHYRVSRSDRVSANAIVNAVDGLPLALDQAGAYIEETGCSVAAYLNCYRNHHAELLKRRGSSLYGHPDSVATTWSVSFERIVKTNPAAADLLQLCAFFAPDAIPEEMLLESASKIGSFLEPIASNSLYLNTAISELRRFSFVRRKDGMLSIHRLVQTVLREWMTDEIQRQWAEKAIQIVNAVFPNVVFGTWTQAQRYLPQAEACAILVEEYDLRSTEAARLLHQTGWYLRENAQFVQSEHLLRLSLTIYKQTVGIEHPDVADTLNHLALLYHIQGRFSEAEPLYREALAISAKTSAKENFEVARVLNNWAELYRAQGRHSEAEPLYLRSLEIRQNVLGAETREVALVLNNLARIYYVHGQYVKAEAFYQRAMIVWEKILKPEQPDIQYAAILDNLSMLYYAQGEYNKAEQFMLHAVTIRQKVLGAKHPHFARSLCGLAKIYCSQGRSSEAETLMRRALAICEQMLGPKHHSTLSMLENLAEIHRVQGHHAEAESLYPRIREMYESLSIPAMIALKEHEPIYQQILRTYEKVPIPDDPEIATIFEIYTAQLQKIGRIQESIIFDERSKSIRAKFSAKKS